MSESLSTVRRNRPARWLVFLLVLALASWVLPGSAGAQTADEPDQRAHLDERLVEEARAADDGRMQVLMVLDAAPDLSGMDGDRAEVVAALRDVAEQSQAEVEAELEDRAEELGDPRVVNGMWIQNMLLVEVDPSEEHLAELATVTGVNRLVANFEVTVVEPEPADEMRANIVEDRTWGIDRIEAHRVQDELGIRGGGVRVATLDTGVDISHPDLQGRMVTDDPGDPTYPGGWMEFDGSGNLVESEPQDSSYHGTHVAGTIHGGDTSDVQIGVAPDSDMMHGMVIPGGSGTFVQVAAGMQWAIDPVDADGNPAGQPADVVNMSLGGCGLSQEMVAPTRNIRAAGVFPAFAIGNAGLNCPSCGPADSGSPGNVYESVGVGATDSDDDVASFSCGAVLNKSDWPNPPADWPETYVKPDLSAPGVDTYSADPGGGYRRLSGTSMATPHVAGTAALMLSAAPGYDVDAVESQLATTSFWDDRHGPERPNPRYGHGRINAYEAVVPIAVDSGIEGTITDDATGDPIVGAEVTNVDTGVTLTTDADGRYTMRLLPGTYEVSADAFGYEPATATADVVEDELTTLDLALTPQPTGTITGTVTFDDSGHGVPGVPIEVVDTPLSATTGADGSYTVDDVPVGTYTVAANPDGFPSPADQSVEVQEGATATADFGLAAPADDIAMVTSDPGSQFADYFDSLDVEVDFYTPDELAQAADYRTVIYGYNFTDPGDAAFNTFLANTDAAGTGVVFLDQAFTTWNGIRTLSTYAGQPESTDTSTGGTGQNNQYEVTAEHPILEGFEVGDTFVHDDQNTAWAAWFDGYEGDGRQVIAEAGRTGDDEPLGHGIAVEERGNNRHALLSLHSSSATRGPADWTAETESVFWNAIEWASPPADPDQPRFVPWDLQVEPDVVLGDQPVDVSAQVTNVGATAGDYTATLLVDGAVEDTTTVTLDPAETTTVEWTTSRSELGTYEVQVGHLVDSFRVRPPMVELTARTLEGDGATAAPLSDATVELLEGDQRTSVGTTDEQGRLAFETTAPAADYTIVVRRAATDDHEHAYLLARPLHVDDDVAVEFAPLTGAASEGDPDSAAVVDLAAETAADGQQFVTYVRNDLVGPHGFGYSPGTLVTSVAGASSFEAVHVQAVQHHERDWWAATEILADLPWLDPTAHDHPFGGRPTLELDAEYTEGTEFAATWAVRDRYDHPFELMLESELRPFADLPDVIELEDVPDMLRGIAVDPTEIVMRLLRPNGSELHAGGIAWEERTVVRDLQEIVDEPVRGKLRLQLEVDTGGYADTLTEQAVLSGSPSGSNGR